MLNFVLYKVGLRNGFCLFWILFGFFTSNYVVICTSFYNQKRFASSLVSVEPILVKTHGSFLFYSTGDSPLFTEYVTIIYVVVGKACTEVTLSLKKDKFRNFDLVELLAGGFFQMLTVISENWLKSRIWRGHL